MPFSSYTDFHSMHICICQGSGSVDSACVCTHQVWVSCLLQTADLSALCLLRQHALISEQRGGMGPLDPPLTNLYSKYS